MNEEIARKILVDMVQSDNTLYSISYYIDWDFEEKIGQIDARCTIEELEAIVWWVKNMLTK